MGRSTCSLLLNIVNFIVAALITTAGVLICIGAVGAGIDGFSRFIVGAYLTLFGLLLLLAEFKLPTFMHAYIGFISTFLGRGLWYLFLGCLILPAPANSGIPLFLFIAGIFIIIVGFIFIILQFIAAVDRPRPIYVQQQQA